MSLSKDAECFADLSPSLAALTRQTGWTRKARTGARCQILLALYDGEDWIEQQLQSFTAQTYDNWELIVSDDGSADHGLEKVWSFVLSNPDRRFRIIEGPGRGHAANFFRLLEAADIRCAYTAFSDQDDVWKSEKLERAIAALAKVDENMPALYAGRSLICGRSLDPIHCSQALSHPPAFANALVQNICAGHCIVMNNAALRLVKKTLFALDDVPAHDWWLYMLVSGAGGQIIFDDLPMIYYRQHVNNAIGAKLRVKHFWTRFCNLFNGQHRTHLAANSRALMDVSEVLTEASREVLRDWNAARAGKSWLSRLGRYVRSQVHRQSRIESLAFIVATTLKRL